MENHQQTRRVWLVIEDRALEGRKKTLELPLETVVRLSAAQDALKIADAAPVWGEGGTLLRDSSESGAISWALRVAVAGEKKDPALQEALLQRLDGGLSLAGGDCTELIFAEP